MLFATQADFDALRADLAAGNDTLRVRAYNEAKAYADATLTDSIAFYTDPNDSYASYKSALTDHEKMVAWGLAWQGSQDIQYANKAREFFLWYWTNTPHTPQPEVCWRIPSLLTYDLTADSGVYSGDQATIDSTLNSLTGSSLSTGENWQNGGFPLENMTCWTIAMGMLGALALNDQSYINRALALYTDYWLESLASNGATYDFDFRGLDGVDYHKFSLEPILFALRAATNHGYDWWSLTSTSGVSTKTAVDLLLTEEAIKPGAPQGVPSVYGYAPASAPYNPNGGDYSAGLSLQRRLDKRYVFELADSLTPDSAYTEILTTSDHLQRWIDAGHGAVLPTPPVMARELLFNYHGTFWLTAFLGEFEPTDPPPPPPSDEMVTITVDSSTATSYNVEGHAQDVPLGQPTVVDVPEGTPLTVTRNFDNPPPPPPPGNETFTHTGTFDGTDHYDAGQPAFSGQSLVVDWSGTVNVADTNDRRVVSQAENWNEQGHVLMVSVSSSRVRFRLKVNGLTRTLILQTPTVAGGQYTGQCSYDGTELKIDYNGQTATLAATGDINAEAWDCWVGNQPGANPLPGYVGDLTVTVTN